MDKPWWERQTKLTDHVSEVSSALGGLRNTTLAAVRHSGRVHGCPPYLLVGSSVLLGGTELADEAHGLASETAGETSAGTGVEESAEVVGSELEEVVKFDTTVRELWKRGGHGSVHTSLIALYFYRGYRDWRRVETEREIRAG